MDLKLEKATVENAGEIHQMQIRAFKILLEKYEDYDTNPGNENIDKIVARINQKTTDYYIIKFQNISVGAVRICNLDYGKICRIAPIFILPEFQNKGIAQNVFKIIEEKYKPQNGWILDTILQEEGNCYLYEKIGYKKTGKIEKINDKMDIVYYEKKNMEKPVTTLFMLMSVDGKISTGNIDDRDVDKDFPKIAGIKEGLKQYYDIEQTTDLFSMNSGRVMAKVGSNIEKEKVSKTDVSFIIIDNKPHLNNIGIEYFIKLSKVFYLVTNNKNHPAFQYKNIENLCILFYDNKIDFANLFEQLKTKYGINSMTIQTGGTLNSILLREKLIDKLSIVIAPALIGGKGTSTLIDGESLQTFDDLIKIRALKLIENNTLNDSYINLKYEIINETKIE